MTLMNLKKIQWGKNFHHVIDFFNIKRLNLKDFRNTDILTFTPTF